MPALMPLSHNTLSPNGFSCARDTTPRAGPRAGRLAHMRRAAAELTPEAIEQIAQRVTQLLREEADEQAGAAATSRLLDAGELARKLGLNRAWVYEHANELGAIAIGDGPRPRLRFDANLASEALRARRRSGEPKAAPMPAVEPPHRRRHPDASGSSVPLLPIGGSRARGILALVKRARARLS